MKIKVGDVVEVSCPTGPAGLGSTIDEPVKVDRVNKSGIYGHTLSGEPMQLRYHPKTLIEYCGDQPSVLGAKIVRVVKSA